MSKRSRHDFERNSPHIPHSNKPAKRSRKSERDRTKASSIPLPITSSHTSDDGDDPSTFECPVCFEDFSGHIFQCQEGHLLCHLCRPKFRNCPTCRISLDGNIRNRILEQILSTKTSLPSTRARKAKADADAQKLKLANTKTHLCRLCHATFASADALGAHLSVCSWRHIRCPFEDCKWSAPFKDFAAHAQEMHHTCNGSLQPTPMKDPLHEEQPAAYTFNHAIKFPSDTFARNSSDFVWPKIVRFADGEEFFVLSRYKGGFITVFVRQMKLAKLSREERKALNCERGMDAKSQLALADGEGEILGNYSIEFRMKETEQKRSSSAKNGNVNGNGNGKGNVKNVNDYRAVPLRWPSYLYAVTVPFDYEAKVGQVLKIHHSIFTKYWAQQNAHSSAVLRFQFRAVLS